LVRRRRFRTKVAAVLGAGAMATLAAVALPATNAGAVTGNFNAAAYGISVKLGSSTIVPPTPAVSTSSDGDTVVGPKCIASVPTSIARADTVCAAASTNTVGPSAFAQSEVQDAAVFIPGLPVIIIFAAESAAGAHCDATTRGVFTIAYLKIGPNVIISGQTQPKPNTTIPLGAAKIVLNEQSLVAGNPHSIAVNGVHVSAPGIADVIISAAAASINAC
jgi:hypothetical protein